MRRGGGINERENCYFNERERKKDEEEQQKERRSNDLLLDIDVVVETTNEVKSCKINSAPTLLSPRYKNFRRHDSFFQHVSGQKKEEQQVK